MATTPATSGRLDSGVVTTATRRRVMWLLAAAALAWRLPALLQLLRGDRTALVAAMEALVPVPFTRESFGLGPFLTSPQIAWVGSPLYLAAVAVDASLRAQGVLLLALQVLLSVALVVVIFRVGQRWVGHRAAVVAALLCAANAQAVQASTAPLPALATSLVSLAVAGGLSRIHPRSEPRAAWRLGMGVGTLSLLSGLAVLWAALAAAWLPSRGKSFRGLRYLSALGYLVVGVGAVISPLLLHNALAQRDLIVPWSTASFDLYTGLTQLATVAPADLAHADDTLARRQYAALVSARQDPHASRREAARSWRWLGRSAAALVARPAAVLGAGVRRALWFLGGGHPAAATPHASAPAPRRGLPVVPLGVITAVAWLGFFALLASLRAYLPLYACAGLPLVCAALTGVTPGWQLVALPAHCLLAGYGVARVLAARRTPSTWLLALPLLAVGSAVAAWF